MKKINVINSKNVSAHLAGLGKTTVSQIYQGDAKTNLDSKNNEIGSKIIVPYKANWKDSAECARLYDDIEKLQNIAKKKVNAAQAPTTAVVEALLGKVIFDITRRAQEAGDLTPLIANVISNPNADKTVTVSDIEKYLGKVKTIAGTNDSVPLIEQKTGNTDTFSIVIDALGWKDSIENTLFNRLFTMEKVNQAAADAFTDRNNALRIGLIVAATYVASQKQAADTTGTTFDAKLYNTVRKGIKKLRALKDPQTLRPIVIPSISLLVNSNDTWDFERVLNGQLSSGGQNGLITSSNMQGLPIANIIEYDQGITNARVWGKETLAFPGVTQGKAYLFVPNEYWFVMQKRGITLETGKGSVLQLSTEEKAWYQATGQYEDAFFGSSLSGTSLGANFGSIIELTLPTDS